MNSKTISSLNISVPAFLVTSIAALTPAPANELFWQFIQVYIKNCPKSAPLLAQTLAEFRDNNLDQPLKMQNWDLYYGQLIYRMLLLLSVLQR